MKWMVGSNKLLLLRYIYVPSLLLLIYLTVYINKHAVNVQDFSSVVPGQMLQSHDSVHWRIMAEATAGDSDETKHSWPHFFLLPVSEYGFQIALAAYINRPQSSELQL